VGRAGVAAIIAVGPEIKLASSSASSKDDVVDTRWCGNGPRPPDLDDRCGEGDGAAMEMVNGSNGASMLIAFGLSSSSPPVAKSPLKPSSTALVTPCTNEAWVGLVKGENKVVPPDELEFRKAKRNTFNNEFVVQCIWEVS
jgi:hypothetical protein